MASESSTGSDSSACYLMKCPPEIIFMFSEALGDDVHSRLSFRGSCQDINAILEGGIYRHNILKNGASCMVWAATNGQLVTMKKAVAAGADLLRDYENVFDTRTAPLGYRVHFSLLHFALANGHADVATYLVEQGVHIHEDASGAFGRHVDFQWPQSTWNVSMGSNLGTRGASFAWGYNPLQIAIGKGLLSVANLLIASGALRQRIRDSYDQFRAHRAIRRAALLGHHVLIPNIAANVALAELGAILRGLKSRSPLAGPKLDPLRKSVWYFIIPSDENVETVRALLALPHDECFDRKLWLDRAVSNGNCKLSLAVIQRPAPDHEGNEYARLDWDCWVSKTFRGEFLFQMRTTLKSILARLEESNVTFPTETWLQDSFALIKALVVMCGDRSYERLAFAEWRIRDHLDPYAWMPRSAHMPGVEEIEVPPLQFAAYYCRKSPHAVKLMELLLDMGVSRDELEWDATPKSLVYEYPPYKRLEGYKTALQYLVEALEINHFLDYDTQYEEDVQDYLETTSDQIRLGHKERRILDAIELLLSRGASPQRWAHGARDKSGYRVTILELALSKFDITGQHIYADHQDARVGLVTLKLARLFLKHAERSALPAETVRTLKWLVPHLFRILRRQPPLTNLKIRTKYPLSHMTDPPISSLLRREEEEEEAFRAEFYD